MKKALILIFSCCTLFFNAQNFTWMRGSSQSGIAGNYGPLGVMSPTIDPGGRHGSGRWVDANGDIWMFGGEGYSSTNTVSWLSDLWKYSVSQNQWTYVGGASIANQLSNYGTQGVAAPTNQPGAREFPVCWTDNNGKFWMFGGFGFTANTAQISAERLGDLWKYDPVTNLWTWMGGFTTSMQNGVYGTMGAASPANRPGCRMASGTWVNTAGELFLFGGRGYPASGVEGFLNDVWKYNVTTNQWTWVSGSAQQGQTGSFGTLGVNAFGNIPSGREFPAVWQDASGRVYLFGGRGPLNYTSDLWRYDPLGNTWAWIKGPQTGNQIGTYGTQNTAATANNPGGRFAQASWTDKFGQFWLFGGQGKDTSIYSGVGFLNDLWRYDVCTNNWIWVKGNFIKNQQGNYGTVTVPASSNQPGSRFYINYWLDKNKRDLWLIGGEGYDASVFVADHMNDVWKYSALAPSDSILAVSGTSLCSGAQATLTSSGANSTTQWFSGANSAAVLSSGSSYTTTPLFTLSNDSTIDYFAQIACASMPRSQVTILVHPVPNLSFTTPSTICVGSSFTIAATGAQTYTWLNGSTGAAVSATASGLSYSTSVIATNAFGCQSTSVVTVPNIVPLPSFSLSLSGSVTCVNSPLFVTAQGVSSGTVNWNNNQSAYTASYTASAPVNAHISATLTAGNGCKSTQTITALFSACAGFETIEETSAQFSILPNPNTGSFYLQSLGADITNAKIYNFAGQLLYTSDVNAINQKIELQLLSGLYFIEVSSAEGLLNRKSFVVYY